jgi:hypothetical protein
MHLPSARGPLTETIFGALRHSPHDFVTPPIEGDPLAGQDFHLALYIIYELAYRGIEQIDDAWEWEPSLIRARRDLEHEFESALRRAVPVSHPSEDIPKALRALADSARGPSLADYLQNRATLDEFKEFVVHRSAYHLKESDPHSWAIPRLTGKPKAALLEIQYDEYGSGDPARIHAQLFANTMEALGLDPTYGAYIDVIPGVTLATVNLMTFFGLNRRLRGAAIGHLAFFEMTSSAPNRKFGNGLRRLECHHATEFFDEHVEADAVHEMIAAHDLAASLALKEPEIAGDILFGAKALASYDDRFARHMLDSWSASHSSLLGESVLEHPAR